MLGTAGLSEPTGKPSHAARRRLCHAHHTPNTRSPEGGPAPGPGLLDSEPYSSLPDSTEGPRPAPASTTLGSREGKAPACFPFPAGSLQAMRPLSLRVKNPLRGPAAGVLRQPPCPEPGPGPNPEDGKAFHCPLPWKVVEGQLQDGERLSRPGHVA